MNIQISSLSHSEIPVSSDVKLTEEQSLEYLFIVWFKIIL